MNFRKKNSKTPNKPLTTGQKRVLDKAVQKTVREYKKTLDLLAKT